MPSLVYITRLDTLSPDLAEGLESAGFHVKSFAPGDITSDDCLLVMTAEAAPVGLPFPGTTPPAGANSENGFEWMSAMRKSTIHAESQAAILKSIKAVASAQPVKAEPQVIPAAVPAKLTAGADKTLGFISTQARLRTLATPQLNSSLVPQPGAFEQKKTADQTAENKLPENKPVKKNGAEAVPLHLLKFPEKVEEVFVQNPVLPEETNSGPAAQPPAVKPARSFWKPLAAAAGLVILAGALLGRASIFDSPADETPAKADIPETHPQAESLDTGEKAASGSALTPVPAASKPENPSEMKPAEVPSAEVPNETRRHISDYDFVAEDYTNHFDLHHHRLTARSHELRQGAQNRFARKRIVDN
jgi:hypothetical protein